MYVNTHSNEMERTLHSATVKQQPLLLGQYVSKPNKERLNHSETNSTQSSTHTTQHIPVILLQTHNTVHAFSYRVKPNPAQGKRELHVLRHCAQQQA